MKEVKTKSGTKTKARLSRKNIEGLSPYSKPALRSEAFARALREPASLEIAKKRGFELVP